MVNYEKDPVLVRGTDDIWWVGFGDKKVGFANNPYLIVEDDEAMLIDPGPRGKFYKIVHNKVAKALKGDFEKIKYMAVQHEDPDLCAALPLFAQIIDENAKLYAQTRSAAFIPYFGYEGPIVTIEDNDEMTFKSGRKLTFITTPYVHFAGANVIYDHKTKTLFSSDIFGAFSVDWNLYANEYYIEAMKAFGEPYFGDHRSVASAMEKFEKLDIERICPQHGSIIDGKENVKNAIKATKEMIVGQWV